MAERFYIWEDDERNGPYTERQVERMLEDGIISFSHECEPAGGGERLTLDELFEAGHDEDENHEGEGEWENDEAESDDEAEALGTEEDWEEHDEDEDYEDGDDEGEEDAGEEWEDEDWEEDDELPPPGTILYQGHPTLLRYVGALALVVLGIGFGLWLGPRGIWYFIGGFGVATFTLIAILIDRSSRVYSVTPRRVELCWGLVARSSKEVRIDDIRTINVRRSGIPGLLGVGTVEFSSTGDGVDVEFTDIWAAQRVKTLVRELQDALE